MPDTDPMPVRQPAAHPFAASVYGSHQTYHLTVDDRIAAVRNFDRAQCQAALALPDLQKTVARAVHARLRRLDRDAATQQVAWCWASGLIEVGDALPTIDPDGNGPIQIARGPRAALLAQLNTLARHGKGAGRSQLLVPGVPEARTSRDAVDALSVWVLWCGAHDSRDGVVWGKRA